ncbi:hypothetical protein NSU_0312 [Novosphingobium pentaromativorans US6-1]|uniref:Uncharacterized protein n=1 Tax=Novosphingobium pentaromativorans US6-1 TaxID=1088721 RepID=G6E7H7_9SPHN|nr:hypothetical protein NSU_0312 [Novosphingobium pentaromativorans US6-1]
MAKACWKSAPFDVGGKMITLERGQLSYSIRELAEQWGWSKSTADRFLKRLELEGMVNLTRAKTGTARGTSSGTDRLIITVCNYRKYQDFSPEAGTASEPQNGTELGQKRDIKEQGNKGTRDIPSPDGDGRGAPDLLALDACAIIFRTGLTILKATGHDDRNARSIIGRWRKTYSDGSVLAVLARCQTAQPSNPVEWVTKALQAEQQRAAGQAPQPMEQRPQRAAVSEIGAEIAARRRASRQEQEKRIAISGR